MIDPEFENSLTLFMANHWAAFGEQAQPQQQLAVFHQYRAQMRDYLQNVPPPHSETAQPHPRLRLGSLHPPVPEQNAGRGRAADGHAAESGGRGEFQIVHQGLPQKLRGSGDLQGAHRQKHQGLRKQEGQGEGYYFCRRQQSARGTLRQAPQAPPQEEGGSRGEDRGRTAGARPHPHRQAHPQGMILLILTVIRIQCTESPISFIRHGARFLR